MKVVTALVVLVAAAAAAHAQDAATSAPGGLSPEQTPQFVLFTHDDALTQLTYDTMTAVTNGRASLDMGRGTCPAVATYFTTTTNTDCELLVELYSKGNEIADHTISHPSLNTLQGAALRREILGAREELAACGIPEEDIVGLRAPFLEIKGEVWEILQENGFLYDSTLIEEGTGNSLTGGMDSRVWPWDMENGIPTNCDWYSTFQKCEEGATYPGLWQIPVWDLAALGGPYTMDYGDDNAHSVFDILKANFDAAYNGNRAPFPIFIHTPWMQQHVEDVEKFADYALSKNNTYFVTIRQLLAWIKNPIPADRLTPEALGCGNPGGAGPSFVPILNSTSTDRVPMGTYNSTMGAALTPAPALAPMPAMAPGPDGPDGMLGASTGQVDVLVDGAPAATNDTQEDVVQQPANRRLLHK